MYKVYLGANYPEKYKVEILKSAIAKNATIVLKPENADLFIFPILYEILFEYNEEEYKKASFTQNEIEDLKVQFDQMISSAVFHKKKIIIFYYRDPIKKLNIPNAIVFRTSLMKSNRDKEYALPAFVDDVRKRMELPVKEILLPKSKIPTVGFRGQSAPITLPVALQFKRKANRVLESLNINKKINLYYNFGYLARRDTIVACINNKMIKADMVITTAQQSFDGNTAITLFLNNLFNNQYNLCASGHGNYSFRLYETLSANRIPVFINTDCVLPFEEFVDWKKHVVWIEEKDAHKADKFILEFHNSIHPDDFLQLQEDNRIMWEQYLCSDGFFKNLHVYFDLLDF